MNNSRISERGPVSIVTVWPPVIIVCAVVAALAGCLQSASPVPQEKAGYVGVWERGQYPLDSFDEFRSTYVFLHITQDGHVVYARFRKTENSQSCTSVGRSTLKSLTDEQIDIEILWLFTMSFEVNEPPHEADGEWEMTVDGNELTRSMRSADTQPYTFDCGDDDLVREQTI